MGFSNSKVKTAKVNTPREKKKTEENEEVYVEQSKPKYQMLTLLGQGTSGKVYECVDLNTKQHYAMKIITLTSKTKAEAIQEIESLKREISLLKKLNHKNIVKYVSFQVSDDLKSVEIVLEKVTPGNLRDLVKKKSLTEQQASKICKQLLQALRYLHNQGIIHRDLKGANILINELGIPQLSDFGTARIISLKNIEDNVATKCRSLKGTPYWMAPEVLKRSGHSLSADIWSLGCTLIEMLTGKPPWSGLSNRFEEIIGYIASGIQPPFPLKISKTCQKFLNCCLDTNPMKRLRAEQLLHHPFIREPCTEDSLQQIDIEELESLKQSQPQRRPFSQKVKTEQDQNIEKVEQPLAKPGRVETSKSRFNVKLTKDKELNNRPESLRVLDMIDTKVSKKEREELEAIQRRKQAEKREKAKKWEEQLKIEASRMAKKKR